jgi:hypothetical protein
MVTPGCGGFFLQNQIVFSSSLSWSVTEEEIFQYPPLIHGNAKVLSLDLLPLQQIVNFWSGLAVTTLAVNK